MDMSKKLIAVIAGVLLLALAGIYLISKQEAPQSVDIADGVPDVVATVNGQELYKKEFEVRASQISARVGDEAGLSQEQKEAVVTQMVSEELLLQDAAAKNISLTDEEVNVQLETLKGNFESPEQYQQALQSENITEDDLRINIREQLTIDEYIEMAIEGKNVDPTDEEVQAAYDESISGMENAPTLEEVRDQVVEQVKQEKIAVIMDEVLQGLRESADIQIFI